MDTTSEIAAERMDLVTRFLSDVGSLSRLEIETYLVRILTDDPNGIVRHEAAFVLGELHDRGIIQGDDAVVALCDVALNDVSVVARHEAAESLAVFAHEIAAQTLKALATDAEPDVAATARIALAHRVRLFPCC